MLCNVSIVDAKRQAETSHSTGSEYAIERHHDVRSFVALADEWRGLIPPDIFGNLFSDPDWLRIAWKDFGARAQMWLLAVRRRGILVGIAPMVLEPKPFRGMPTRTLRFMTNRYTSRGGIITAAGETSGVAHALAWYWRRNARHWDVLTLNDMPADTASSDDMIDALRRARLLGVRSEPAKSLFRIEFAGDYASYLATRSRNTRSNIRRSVRRLEEAGGHQCLVFEGERLTEGFDRLKAVATKSTKEKNDELALRNHGFEFFESIILNTCEEIQCSVRITNTQGADVAAMLSIRYLNIYYPLVIYHDENYNDLWPGWFSIDGFLRDCWPSEGRIRIDLNSDGDNIRPWASGRGDLVTFHAFNRWPYSAALAGVRGAKRAIKRLRSDRNA